MKVLVISKNDFVVIQMLDVNSITFTPTSFSITSNGATNSYLKNDFILQILW